MVQEVVENDSADATVAIDKGVDVLEREMDAGESLRTESTGDGFIAVGHTTYCVSFQRKLTHGGRVIQAERPGPSLIARPDDLGSARSPKLLLLQTPTDQSLT